MHLSDTSVDLAFIRTYMRTFLHSLKNEFFFLFRNYKQGCSFFTIWVGMLKLTYMHTRRHTDTHARASRSLGKKKNIIKEQRRASQELELSAVVTS